MSRRRWRLGVTGLACAIGLIAVSAASAAATRIHLDVPDTVARGEIFSISAHLVDGAGRPVGDAEVAFYHVTSVGSLPIKTVTTDEDGRASLRLRETYLDRLTVGARFGGGGRLGPAQVEQEIVFAGGSSAHAAHPARHSPTPALATKVVVFLTVGGVWITYGFVVLLTVRMAQNR